MVHSHVHLFEKGMGESIILLGSMKVHTNAWMFLQLCLPLKPVLWAQMLALEWAHMMCPIMNSTCHPHHCPFCCPLPLSLSPLPSLLPLPSSLPTTLVAVAIALFVAVPVPHPTPLSPLPSPLPPLPLPYLSPTTLIADAIALFVALAIAATIAFTALTVNLFFARPPPLVLLPYLLPPLPLHYFCPHCYCPCWPHPLCSLPHSLLLPTKREIALFVTRHPCGCCHCPLCCCCRPLPDTLVTYALVGERIGGWNVY